MDRKIDLEDPHGTLEEFDAEEQRVESLINKTMKNTKDNLDKKDKEIFNKLVKDRDTHRILRHIAYRAIFLEK